MKDNAKLPVVDVPIQRNIMKKLKKKFE